MGPSAMMMMGGGSAPAPAPMTAAEAEQPSFYFILNAPKAQLSIPDASAPTKGRIVLRDVADKSVYFAERPSRNAGVLDTSSLVNEATFRTSGTWLDSPNAGA